MFKNFSEFELQELLLHSARNGDISQLQYLFEARSSGEIELDISCKGEYFGGKSNLKLVFMLLQKS